MNKKISIGVFFKDPENASLFGVRTYEKRGYKRELWIGLRLGTIHSTVILGHF